MTEKKSLKHYIHNIEHWTTEDADEIKLFLEKIPSRESEDAAIGEGAGGSGLETVIEILIMNPISQGIAAAVIYDLIKFLSNKRPMKRKIVSSRHYRLLLHIQDHDTYKRIGVELNEKIADQMNVNLIRKGLKNKKSIVEISSDQKVTRM